MASNAFGTVGWQGFTPAKPAVTNPFTTDESVQVTRAIGEVIRFEPIPGMKTSYQAQVIRILAPAFFENDEEEPHDIDIAE